MSSAAESELVGRILGRYVISLRAQGLTVLQDGRVFDMH